MCHKHCCWWPPEALKAEHWTASVVPCIHWTPLQKHARKLLKYMRIPFRSTHQKNKKEVTPSNTEESPTCRRLFAPLLHCFMATNTAVSMNSLSIWKRLVQFHRKMKRNLSCTIGLTKRDSRSYADSFKKRNDLAMPPAKNKVRRNKVSWKPGWRQTMHETEGRRRVGDRHTVLS